MRWSRPDDAPAARGAELVLASHNEGKRAEIAQLMHAARDRHCVRRELGLPEPRDAPDFVGNARIKALAAARASGLPALSDDFGLLCRGPGWRARRVLGALGGTGKGFRTGDGASARRSAMRRTGAPGSLARFAWLGRTAMRDVRRAGGMERRSGRRAATGIRLRSDVPARRARTFGEMEPEEKHAISHRARAFEQLRLACLV